ncbi:MAG: hypothetical protein WCO23_02885 [bacterium]
MEEPKILILSTETSDFITKFLSAFKESQTYYVDSKSDKIVNSALVYEKIRVALEYQEEHLVFKNAISRIVRRKITLSPNITPKELINDLISELSWANYINPELLSDEKWEEIEKLIDRYLILLRSARSGRFNNHELQKIIIDWLAVDIDVFLKPHHENDYLIDYTYSVLKQNLILDGSRVTEEENEIELKSIIYTLLIKPDLSQIQAWLVNKLYPELHTCDREELKKFGRSFDPNFNKIDHYINHPNRNRYNLFVKRSIPPFLVMKAALITGNLDASKIIEEPGRLHSLSLDVYSTMIQSVRRKVVQATIRSFIFIFLSKVSLAFIIEVPYDRWATGTVNMLSLFINILMPPVLMFVSGIFVKSPPKKNYSVMSESLSNILFKHRLDDKLFPLIEKKKPRFFEVFNAIYSIISMAVIALSLWMLISLDFNIVSIFLFYFFVSVVSFFAFRIRNIALELAMRRGRDDAITSLIELAFLPFIRVGRYLSSQISRFNPFILFLDFLIEAPLKTIIKIVNSWYRFISSKKDEIEL